MAETKANILIRKLTNIKRKEFYKDLEIMEDMIRFVETYEPEKLDKIEKYLEQKEKFINIKDDIETGIINTLNSGDLQKFNNDMDRLENLEEKFKGDV